MSDVPSNLIPTRLTQLPVAPVASEDSLMMIVYQGNNYQIRVGDLLSVAGVPTSTQVIAGTGLAGGGALTGNVTLSVAVGGIGNTQLADTGVTAGTYGNATNIPVFTVDAKGRIQAATTIPATGGSGSYVPTTRQVIAGTGLNGGGELTSNVTLNANLSSALPLVTDGLGSAGVSTNIARADHQHPSVNLQDSDEVDGVLSVANGGTSRSLVPSAGAIVWSGADGLYIGPVGAAGQVLVSDGTNEYNWANQSSLSVGSADNINGGLTNQIVYQTGAGATGFIPAPSFANTILYWDGSNLVWGSVPGTGTVTSVGLSLPSDFAVSNSPVTSAGVLTASWLAQPANQILSGPTSGVDATPAFRSLTNQDIPSALSGKTITTSTIDGSANTLSNIANASLTNSAITINGTPVSLGGSTSITPASIGAIASVSGTTNEVTAATVSGAVTVSLPTALTFTGKTVTNGTYSNPAITGTVKLTGTGASAYTPFVQTFNSAVTTFNGYQLNYIQNTSNGSDASVDYVAYNDSSDVDSYFVDMGIASSNYTNATYTIFPANGGYVYTGGGTSGQASALLLGTSNAASDLILFTGGTLLANTRATIKGNTGNVLIGTTTDTGYKFNVNGTTYFGGASTFGSTVELNANPTTALQAATKQYVDNQVTAGIHIHEPVLVNTTANLNATYTGGGTNANIILIANGTDISFFTVTPSVGDQFYIGSSSNGLLANTAYFVVNIVSPGTIQASLTFGGAIVTGLTNGAPTIPSVINSGVGATLTNAGTQAALSIDGVSLSVNDRVLVTHQTTGAQNGVYTVTTVGSGATNWVMTRATDADRVNPSDPDGVGTGDYFYVQQGTDGQGDSYVLTTEPNTMIIGYTDLVYTQFSGAITYSGGQNIDITGQVVSLTGTVPATNGGTGTNTVATGDLLYGSGTNAWSKLPLGVAYKSLIVNASGTQLEWNATPLNQPTAVSGTLGIANGGTNSTATPTAGGAIYGTGSAYAVTSAGTAGQVLISAGASAPTWGNLDGGTF